MRPDRFQRQTERIVDRLAQLAGSGPDGGVTRTVFSEEHVRARALLVGWGREAGLTAEVDPVGNLWLLPEGRRSNLTLIGSHLDSVPCGGMYDGALGVVLGLEIASRRTSSHADTAVVDFVCEESARFGVGTVGSSVYAGGRSLQQAFALRDSDGSAFGDLRQSQWSELDVPASPATDHFRCYLEIHVDQATGLLELGAPVAAVDVIAAPIRWKVAVQGVQAHSGAAAMDRRQDALLAAADLIVRLQRHAREFPDGEIRTTVGKLEVHPNSPNVVPGRVEMILDLRILRSDQLDGFTGHLGEQIASVELDHRVSVELTELQSDTPAAMHDGLRNILGEAAQRRGVTLPTVPSWSAHDALHMAAALPTGMLLVRNGGGVSHSPRERVGFDDIRTTYALLESGAELGWESSGA